MAPFQCDCHRCRVSSSPVLALISLKPECCMDWTLLFTKIASLGFPNAYKTESVSEVHPDRNSEHTKSRHWKSHRSSSSNNNLIGSHQISWGCWAQAALLRQQLTDSLPGAAATSLVFCTWHFPQQVHLLNTETEPTTLKEHPPPLKLRLFGLPGYKLKLCLNHLALKSCKSTAARKKGPLGNNTFIIIIYLFFN